MISDQIKKLRLEKHFTQKQVASAIHVKVSTYSGYESGYRTPDIEKLTALADFFETSVDELLQHDYPGKEVIEKYNQIDAHGKKLTNCILDLEYERCSKPEITYCKARMASRSKDGKPVRTEYIPTEQAKEFMNLESTDEDL